MGDHDGLESVITIRWNAHTLLPASAIRVELAAKRLEMAVLTSPTISRELILGAPAIDKTSGVVVLSTIHRLDVPGAVPNADLRRWLGKAIGAKAERANQTC